MDERAISRLERETVIWVTTVGPGGQPQSSPVWFVWCDGAVHVASHPDARKIANVTANPRVALHLEGAAPGELVVTLEGDAVVGPLPPAVLASYTAKYADGMARLDATPEEYFAAFAAGLRITPTRSRVFPSG